MVVCQIMSIVLGLWMIDAREMAEVKEIAKEETEEEPPQLIEVDEDEIEYQPELTIDAVSLIRTRLHVEAFTLARILLNAWLIRALLEDVDEIIDLVGGLTLLSRQTAQEILQLLIDQVTPPNDTPPLPIEFRGPLEDLASFMAISVGVTTSQMLPALADAAKTIRAVLADDIIAAQEKKAALKANPDSPSQPGLVDRLLSNLHVDQVQAVVQAKARLQVQIAHQEAKQKRWDQCILGPLYTSAADNSEPKEEERLLEWPFTDEEILLLYFLFLADKNPRCLGKRVLLQERCRLYASSGAAGQLELYVRNRMDNYCIIIFDMWSDHDLTNLLNILKRLDQFNLKAHGISISHPNLDLVGSILYRLLSIIRIPDLRKRTIFYVTIDLKGSAICPAPLSPERSRLQQMMEAQMSMIDRPMYNIGLTIKRYTKAIGEIVHPILTKLPITAFKLEAPKIKKIDFLDKINWQDSYTLELHICVTNTTIIFPPPPIDKTTKKPLICTQLRIITISQMNQSPHSTYIQYPLVRLLGLTQYFHPTDPVLINTAVVAFLYLSFDVLMSYATIDLDQSICIYELFVLNIPFAFTPEDSAEFHTKLNDIYRNGPNYLSLTDPAPTLYIPNIKVNRLTFSLESFDHPQDPIDLNVMLKCFPYLLFDASAMPSISNPSISLSR
ncbi:hypothetical protein NEHOM01_0377 [Nematocida homosporus]|uniref:uncharacterized protein n=1 Tax=Nematocida homosporus TaxID=1912981 RepID=UPI00221F7B12|nr:uncharacterized protein NEHOM01_0377 [Nematocida homosporus]KAI5184775.1 hypothetical protein NEHOM01_0377 [Nematocida homosporus]